MKTLLTLLLLISLPAFATDRPKPKPAPVAVVQEDGDRNEANAFGAAAVAGLMTAAFKDKPNGAVWAFAGTVAAAAAIEAGHSGHYDSDNVWYAVGGAAFGAVGSCYLFFRKNFVGCGLPFK